MRRIAVFIVLVLGAPPLLASAQPNEHVDPDLQATLERLVEGFRGDVGLYVRHLPTGRFAAINAEEVFPSASLIKVPIAAAVLHKVERGELSYPQQLVYRDTLRTAGAGLLAAFKDGEVIKLSELFSLALPMSDNTAALWLQHLAGGGKAINGWLKANGLAKTRVNAGTPGRLKQWRQYNWGQTTPREMAELLVMIRNGGIVSPAASDELYRLLTRSHLDDEMLSQIPPFVQAASKQGSTARARSEVVLVNAPHGDYVFCVMTKNVEDTRWGADNEAFTLLRAVARTLWQHFEPESTWRPVEGVERYW